MSQPKAFHNGRVVLHGGDCLDILDGLAEASVDAIVTDPPYHLLSTVKRFAKSGGADRRHNGDNQYGRLSRGFMGKEWDGGDIAFRPETWAKVLRVLKPGGHLVAFSAPKCAHRMICAIEDAGFEIRDGLMWVFGSGFPKSHNLDGDWQGWGTALKPAYEPICLARKPLSEKNVAANVLKWGTGALNIDGCRIETSEGTARVSGVNRGVYGADDRAGMVRGGSENGRFPANLCHDGGDEVSALFPETGKSSGGNTGKKERGIYGAFDGLGGGESDFGDTGSAARFFYCAKADANDRAFSKHPTVKPIALMRWLVRMVTPPGGTILDPFAGTGTSAHAALLEGFNAVLIEREEEYRADIARRMGLVFAGSIEKASIRSKLSAEARALDDADLFGGAA